MLSISFSFVHADARKRKSIPNARPHSPDLDAYASSRASSPVVCTFDSGIPINRSKQVNLGRLSGL